MTRNETLERDFITALRKSRRENARAPKHIYTGPLPNIRQRAEYTEAPVERDMPEGERPLNF